MGLAHGNHITVFWKGVGVTTIENNYRRIVHKSTTNSQHFTPEICNGI